MFGIKILPSAKADIREASKWYDDQQKGLGLRFTRYVRSKVHTIAQNPFSYSVKYGNVRAVSLDVFPYMVHFTVENKVIIISAVLHTSRKPLTD